MSGDKQTVSVLRRITKTRPGYDCVAKPCGKNGCGERPGASHGRHGDEWVYVVTDGAFALSLSVFTNRLNGRRLPGSKRTAELHYPPYYPMGADMSGHSDVATDEDDIKSAATGGECEYLDGGRCFRCWTSSIAANEFFQKHGGNNFEQDEGFWLSLEEKWRQIRDHVDERRPRVKQCECCKGEGVVPA